MKIDRARFLSMVAAIGAGGGMTTSAHADQPVHDEAVGVEADRVAQACVPSWTGEYPAGCYNPAAQGWETDYCLSMSEAMAAGPATQMVDCFNNGGNIYDCIESSLASTCPTNEGMAFCAQVTAMCGTSAPPLCDAMMSGLYMPAQKDAAQSLIDTGCAFDMWSAVEGVFL